METVDPIYVRTEAVVTNEGELGSHVGCVAAVYHKPGDKYYAAADYRRFYGSAAY